ncbi:MAG TPA: DNA-3-methyladenine glycosylase [Chloroflexaceae bacterium]|nr:DNA-3-methyladenine glycosylase [Chloroflexaceae bacterium]
MTTLPDHAAAVAHLSAADPVLARVIAGVGPCELQPTGHSFVTLVDAIVSQQISVRAAEAIMGRLAAALGELSPPAILAAGDEALRAVGLSGQKARYLRDLAAHAAVGGLDALPQLDDEAAIAALTTIKGVGRWTAEIYLLFALGRPDVLPADDLGLRYAVQQFYELPAAPPATAVRALGEPWRPHRSVAAWYLWRGRRVL